MDAAGEYTEKFKVTVYVQRENFWIFIFFKIKINFPVVLTNKKRILENE